MGQVDLRRIVLGGQKAKFDRYMNYGFERELYNVHETPHLNGTGIGFVDGYLMFNMAGYTPRTHSCLACKLLT